MVEDFTPKKLDQVVFALHTDAERERVLKLMGVNSLEEIWPEFLNFLQSSTLIQSAVLKRRFSAMELAADYKKALPKDWSGRIEKASESDRRLLLKAFMAFVSHVSDIHPEVLKFLVWFIYKMSLVDGADFELLVDELGITLPCSMESIRNYNPLTLFNTGYEGNQTLAGIKSVQPIESGCVNYPKPIFIWKGSEESLDMLSLRVHKSHCLGSPACFKDAILYGSVHDWRGSELLFIRLLSEIYYKGFVKNIGRKGLWTGGLKLFIHYNNNKPYEISHPSQKASKIRNKPHEFQEIIEIVDSWLKGLEASID